MQVRMVPVGPTLRQFVRSVRDLAAAQGKLARVAIQGEEVEVDTTIIEHLRDPLTHMIRNALHHGIETPEVRRAKGKDPCGSIALSAWREAGSIVIELADDGAGFNRRPHRRGGAAPRPRRGPGEAARRGAVPAGVRARILDRRERHRVVGPGHGHGRRPGTHRGGAGIDRDRELARRRDVDPDPPSAHARDHRRLRRGHRPARPTSSPSTASSSAWSCRSARAPASARASCVCAARRFRSSASAASSASRRLRARAGERRRRPPRPRRAPGIVVDRLHGQNQAVIKPLGELFRGVRGLCGSTILGDGKVAFILDVPGLLENLLSPNPAATAA